MHPVYIRVELRDDSINKLRSIINKTEKKLIIILLKFFAFYNKNFFFHITQKI